jgi:hypothetical protein
MGLHHRNLSDTDFTGKDLAGIPPGSGNPGAAPPMISMRVAGFILAAVAIAVVGFGIGH